MLDHNRRIAEANRLSAEAAQFTKKEQWEPVLADNIKVLALLEKALPVALELQSLLERLYGLDNVAVALNLDSLARIYRGLGQQVDADRAAQRGQLIRDVIFAMSPLRGGLADKLRN